MQPWCSANLAAKCSANLAAVFEYKQDILYRQRAPDSPYRGGGRAVLTVPGLPMTSPVHTRPVLCRSDLYVCVYERSSCRLTLTPPEPGRPGREGGGHSIAVVCYTQPSVLYSAAPPACCRHALPPVISYNPRTVTLTVEYLKHNSLH